MKTNRILFETILVTAITLSGIWFLPQAKTLFALLPVVYLLIERRLRKRAWSDLGFKFKTFLTDLRSNWFWFVLVGLISQPAVALWAKVYFPEYLAHVQARLPFDQGMGWATLLPMLALTLIGEELTYRTLVQGRFTPFTGIPMAVVIASILFGLAHYASGPALIVAVDVGLIMVDSVLFGIIYARSNNLVVTWAAHLLGDILGLLVIMSWTALF
jgi:uncharacterized protein